MADKKNVYFFGEGKAEGIGIGKEILGGKGLGLAQMTESGVPVPAGFTITTEMCAYYNKNKKFADGLKEEVLENIKKLEKAMDVEFGNSEKPLLVSVRSGAASSMPGMMDTILNLGINEKVVEGLVAKSGNEKFAWDSYRRFFQMFSDVAMGVPHSKFEEVLEEQKNKLAEKLGREAKSIKDNELSGEDLKEVIKKYKEVYKQEKGEEFPDDPIDQLWFAIEAVFRSWDNPRAEAYRRLNDIRGLIGTAVNIQAMVFGNMGDSSATGVCFSRNPATGENKFYGEFLINAQGEDVVAGIRTPQEITLDSSRIWASANGIDEEKRKNQYPSLEEVMPDAYKELVGYKDQLEKYYKDMQDMEFTIQDGKLYMLQTRSGKRTASSAVKIAVEMVGEGIIDEKEAVLRVAPNQLDQLLHPNFNVEAKKGAKVIAKGLNASPGAAVGKVVFSADKAEEMNEAKEKVILVRIETSPEDIKGMNAAQGILTARGGATSHAAVVARQMGKCCVAGCSVLDIDYSKKEIRIGDIVVKENEYISLDGSTGEVMLGEVATSEPELSGDFGKLMEWADSFRKIGVRANADIPRDAEMARKFGAEGIGLCRTEHMFFEGDRINWVRQLILVSEDYKAFRKEKEKYEKLSNEGEIKNLQEKNMETIRLYNEALEKLLPMQEQDFYGLFKTMQGFPVTIRLLDPPLHEFLPHTDEEIKALAIEMKVDFEKLKSVKESLFEFNPMLGHRGCRLGITYPEIFDMQVEAIMLAAVKIKKEGSDITPEIMIPLVGNVKEFSILKKNAIEVINRVLTSAGIEMNYKIGTMIEVPRAAITADEIAEEAEFFSFGTNDLTQMGCGFSRDDAGKFLGEYVALEIYDKDPFQVLDQKGIGKLMKIAIDQGRSVRPDIKLGICGEHGGESETVKFCHKIGLNYVSCSPYRVPIARLAAAHGALEDK